MSSQSKYHFVKKLGQGAFADVIQAENQKTHEVVAIKKLKGSFPSIESILQLREINILKHVSTCPLITEMKEIIYEQKQGKLSIVFELLQNSLDKISKPDLMQAKWYFFQCILAVNSIHQLNFVHRDIKPDNFMLLFADNRQNWYSDVVKLGDFGASRSFLEQRPFTEYVATRWYRAPEAILSIGMYDKEMDIFALGCLFYELLTGKVLFPGSNEIEQLDLIHKLLGTPANSMVKQLQKGEPNKEIPTNFKRQKAMYMQQFDPSVPKDCADLIEKLIQYHPKQRITLQNALQHLVFRDLFEIFSKIKSENSCMSDKYYQYIYLAFHSNHSVNHDINQAQSMTKLPALRMSLQNDSMLRLQQRQSITPLPIINLKDRKQSKLEHMDLE